MVANRGRHPILSQGVASPGGPYRSTDYCRCEKCERALSCRTVEAACGTFLPFSRCSSFVRYRG
jgi:hypothetical protein